MNPKNLFINKVTEAINEIDEMNNECVEEFGDKYADCFPALATKRVEIDGKTYRMKIEITLTEIK